AVDRRPRGLRKGVVGMACGKLRRDAARAGKAGLELACLDLVRGRTVLLVGKPGPDRLAELAVSFLASPQREITPGGLVQHRLEPMGFRFLQRAGQLVNGIVRSRPAGMAATVVHGEKIALVGLFGGLERKSERASIGEECAATAVGVERELGIGE